MKPALHNERRVPVVGVIMTLLAVITVYPLVWAVLSSLKSSNLEVLGAPFSLPTGFHWPNYLQAFREGNMGSCLINSLWVTVVSAALTVSFGAWSGFALSKERFPLRRWWLSLFFLGMILPVQAFLIPLGDVLVSLGIHDSLWALIFAYTAQTLPVSVLLFSAYFQALPVEIEEAARLDGVGTARFYCEILLPVAKPAVSTVVVLACLNSWNEFLMAMLLIVDPMRRTLPAGMIAFEQAHNTNYPALLAGLSLIAVPTLVVYAVFNRQVVRGVTAGAVK